MSMTQQEQQLISHHADDDNVLVDRGEGEVCISDVDSNVSIYWE